MARYVHARPQVQWKVDESSAFIQPSPSAFFVDMSYQPEGLALPETLLQLIFRASCGRAKTVAPGNVSSSVGGSYSDVNACFLKQARLLLRRQKKL